MLSEYKLHIGSYGWIYKSWDESFYPEDLPLDWQFAYYANEYSVMMIPWDSLLNNFNLVEQGITDSDEKCRLIFEIPITNINSRTIEDVSTEIHDSLNKISSAGSRTLGIVYVVQFTEISQLSSDIMTQFQKLLMLKQANIITCIDIQGLEDSKLFLDSLPSEFVTTLKQSGTELCRYNELETVLVEGYSSKLHITFCDIPNCEPKQLRKIVENSLLGEGEDSTNVLIFRSDPPSHEQMNTALVISDLL